MTDYNMHFCQPFGAIPMSNDYPFSHELPSNVPQKTSSWFRRPARVSKHASREGSPRSLVRRRTTALVRAPSRQSSTSDGRGHRKQHSTPDGVVSFEARGRPMSWHSTGLEQIAAQALPSTISSQHNDPSSDFLGPTFTTNEVNGAITPATHPFAGEPFVQDIFTPLDEMSSQDFDTRYAFLNEFSADKNPIPSSDYNTWYSIPAQWGYSNPHFELFKQPEPNLYRIELTAPPTPETRPLQSASGITTDYLSADLEEMAGGDDLVGMGLYDAPSPTSATISSLGGTWDIPIRPGPGKGLKLEETFQPSMQVEEDNDDDDVGSVEDGGEEESASDHVQASTLPSLGLEDRMSYYGSDACSELNLTSSTNNGEINPWWGIGVSTAHGWV